MSLPVAGLSSRCIRARCSRPQSTAPQSLISILPFLQPYSIRSIVHQSRGRRIPVPVSPSLLNHDAFAQTKNIRRSIQTQRFQAFAPPSPESLGKAAPPKQYRRTIKWGRRLIYVSAAAGLFYLIDTRVFYSSLTRSLRTFCTSFVIAVDYKLNFRPQPLFGGDINDIHFRVRIFGARHIDNRIFRCTNSGNC